MPKNPAVKKISNLGCFVSEDNLSFMGEASPLGSPAFSSRQASVFRMENPSEAGSPSPASVVRVKRIEYGSEMAADEHLAGTLNVILGIGPRVDFVVPSADAVAASGAAPPIVRLASHVLPGFMDLSRFVVSDEMFEVCGLDNRLTVKALRDQLVSKRREIDNIENRPDAVPRQKTQELLKNGSLPFGQRALSTLSEPLSALLSVDVDAARKEYERAGTGAQRALREAYKDEQGLTAKLLHEMLPQIREEFLATLITEGVVNAHWDILNHRGDNSGFYPDPVSKRWRPAVVDAGNTHGSGFGGRTKSESWIAVVGLPALMANRDANPVHNRDLDVMPSSPVKGRGGWTGVAVPPGGVPRGNVFAKLFRDALAGREGGDLRTSNPHLAAGYRMLQFTGTLSPDLGPSMDQEARNAGIILPDAFFATRIDAAKTRIGAYINTLGRESIDRWAHKHPRWARLIANEVSADMWSEKSTTVDRGELSLCLRPPRTLHFRSLSIGHEPAR